MLSKSFIVTGLCHQRAGNFLRRTAIPRAGDCERDTASALTERACFAGARSRLAIDPLSHRGQYAALRLHSITCFDVHNAWPCRVLAGKAAQAARNRARLRRFT